MFQSRSNNSTYMNIKRWALCLTFGVVAYLLLLLSTHITPSKQAREKDSKWAKIIFTDEHSRASSEDSHKRLTARASDHEAASKHIAPIKIDKTPSFNLTHKDGKKILIGALPEQTHIDQLVRAASDQFGADNITNEITLNNDVSSPKWLDFVMTAIPTLADMQDTDFRINNTETVLAGTFHTQEEKQLFTNVFSETLGVNKMIDNSVVVTLGPTPEELAEVVHQAELAEAKRIAEDIAATKAIEVARIAKEAAELANCQQQLNDVMTGNSILFATSSARINPKSHALLDVIAVTAKNCGDIIIKGRQVIEISGHTDSRGTNEMNLTLSQARAVSVHDYLVEKKVRSSLLISKGYGEVTPITTNDTAAGRQRNRRIQFTIQ